MEIDSTNFLIETFAPFKVSLFFNSFGARFQAWIGSFIKVFLVIFEKALDLIKPDACPLVIRSSSLIIGSSSLNGWSHLWPWKTFLGFYLLTFIDSDKIFYYQNTLTHFPFICDCHFWLSSKVIPNSFALGSWVIISSPTVILIGSTWFLTFRNTKAVFLGLATDMLTTELHRLYQL